MSSDPTTEHTIRLSFSAYGLVSATSVIVYDTTGVPAGMTFNAPALEEGLVTISAG